MGNNKGYEFLEKYLIGSISNLAQFRIVRAIMAAAIISIPFTIVGSMFLVLNVLPITFPGLESFFNDTFYRFSDLYMLANKCTMGILSLYFSIVIGYEYTKIQQEEENLNVSPLNGALLSLFAFFLCIPELVINNGEMVLVNVLTDSKRVIDGWSMGSDGLSRLGTSGVFTAIIMGAIAVKIYSSCVKHNWIIKMPEAVPEGVSRSFSALIPTFLIALVILIMNSVLILFGTDIFQVIAIPFAFVKDLTNSWLGIVVIYLLMCGLWFTGIHGANIISPFWAPIALNNLQANMNGASIPFAGEFSNSFVFIGGSGSTLGLVLFLVFLAKSEQLKILGRAAVVPGIFNINEPIIFGLPIVYNPFFFVPFMLAPVVCASLSYWAIKLNLISPIIANVPWPSPMGLGAFIGTAGDIRAVVLAVVSAVIAFLIYFPFIKAYDKKLLKEEQSSKVL